MSMSLGARAAHISWIASGLVMLALSPVASAAPNGKLVVQAAIKGATVTLDGKEVGKTPLEPLTVRAGTHLVVVSKLGFLEHSSKVTIKAGATARFIADLLPVSGILKVTANVGAAKVSIDGKVVGDAPGEFELPIGRRAVVVTADGHDQHRQVFSVSPGAIYRVDARLKKLAGATASGDLALEPIAAASAPKKATKKKPAAKKGSRAGDELELVPLAPIPAAGAKKPAGKAGDLALEPLVPVDQNAAEQAHDTNIELEPISGSATPDYARPATHGAPVASKPWYKEYWVWGVASGVVVASGALFVASRYGGSPEPSGPRPDKIWAVGVSAN